MFIYLSNKQAWISRPSRHIQHPWPEQTTLNSTCNHFQGHQYLWITGRTNACHGADTILGKDWVSFVLMMARYKNGWGKTTSCWYFLSLSLTKLGCFKNLLRITWCACVWNLHSPPHPGAFGACSARGCSLEMGKSGQRCSINFQQSFEVIWYHVYPTRTCSTAMILFSLSEAMANCEAGSIFGKLS